MGVWLGPRGGKPEPIALYTPGDTNVFTAVQNAFFGGSGKEPGAYYHEDHVEVGITNNLSSGWDTRSGLLVCQSVDLTKYKKIRLSYTNALVEVNRTARLYVSQGANSYDVNLDPWVAASNGSGSLELDVSGLSGAYYVGIALGAGGNSTSSTTGTSMSITAITVTAD